MRRSHIFFIAFALVMGCGILFWPAMPTISQQQIKSTSQIDSRPPLLDTGKPPTLYLGTVNTPTPQIDPANQQKADLLNSPESTPIQDLQIVSDFIEIYAKATGGRPVGDNADITAAITGTQYPDQKGRVFPSQHNAIRNRQLVDRWGTPLWFHANSGFHLELRSAGPDKQLFTQDDILLNPSPAGFGATAPAVNSEK